MKKLTQFLYFDVDSFFQNKDLVAIGMGEWRDYKSKEVLGTKVELAIVKDDTDYGETDGEVISNVYEKFFVKIPRNIKVPMNTLVTLVNAEATVWGDYNNNLSVIAENIIPKQNAK